MSLVAAVLVVAMVFVIAAIAIGREAQRLGHVASEAVFDLDEAVEFVARHVPFEVSAKLSYDDVRQLIQWHMEHLRRTSGSGNGDGDHLGGPVVVAGAETVDHLLARARAAGLDADGRDVHHVVEAEMTYLASIGALGGRADDADPNS